MIYFFFRVWFGDLIEEMYEKLDHWPDWYTWMFPKSWPRFRIYFRTITLVGVLSMIATIIWFLVALSKLKPDYSG